MKGKYVQTILVVKTKKKIHFKTPGFISRENNHHLMAQVL